MRATRLIVPSLFVLSWSTGFIVARAAAPHADLQLFLVARFAGSAAVLGGIAMVSRTPWPRGLQILANLGMGALMMGGYLTLSYWSVSQGIPAGIMALLGALQPLFTAIWVVATGNTRLAPRIWGGLLLGFTGVAMVLRPKLGVSVPGAWPRSAVVLALVAVVALTAGTLLQRRLKPGYLWSGTFIQACGAALVAVAATSMVGDQHWDGAPVLWLSLVWVVLAVSVGSLMLLLWMMQRGEATQVTALFLLIPPLASLQAFAFFHEVLLLSQIAGFALALGGVLLVRADGAR